jgi:hypothetical protein
MQLGLIGLPAAGKTTVFNALTGAGLPVGQMAALGKVEVHTAVVDVPDTRLEELCALLKPRKMTYAKIHFADIGGLEASRGGELPGALLNAIGPMDALIHVVRVFDDPALPHPRGSVDPARDVGWLEEEFLLNDMLVVERRLAKLAEERGKGARPGEQIEREQALFQRLQSQLEGGQPLRALELDREAQAMLAGFTLLSRKPLLLLFNLGEGESPPQISPPSARSQSVWMRGQLEWEICQLPEADREAFMAEYGIEAPARQRVVRACYDLLERCTFFTINEQEGRAWAIQRGATALEAAGTIHSDMERGFIRAEVISWRDLLKAGGFSAARASGLLRVEGKGYQVQDGDVITIRFNV